MHLQRCICDVLTSKTLKNPNRMFYKCSAVPSCGFFKWCDQVSIKSDSISSHPTCPCGSCPCRRVTVINGPNAHRSYFVCCIKKSFGACGFFQLENDSQISSGFERNGSPCSLLTGFPDFDSADDEKLVLESDANLRRRKHGLISRFVEKDEGNSFVDGIAETMKDYAETLSMDAVFARNESINNLKQVSNGRNQGILSLFLFPESEFLDLLCTAFGILVSLRKWLIRIHFGIPSVCMHYYC